MRRSPGGDVLAPGPGNIRIIRTTAICGGPPIRQALSYALSIIISLDSHKSLIRRGLEPLNYAEETVVPKEEGSVQGDPAGR